ncbi:MAG: hypothetical protein ACI83Q_000780 [Colwellia polaris]|jgi:hypothetical protein
MRKITVYKLTLSSEPEERNMEVLTTLNLRVKENFLMSLFEMTHQGKKSFFLSTIVDNS